MHEFEKPAKMIRPYIRLTYGELLRLFRQKNKLTIKAVAERLNVTAETIRNYESDITLPALIRIQMLEKLYGEEFKKLSQYLFSEKAKNDRRTNMETTFFVLETVRFIYRGRFDIIKRRPKPMRV